MKLVYLLDYPVYLLKKPVYLLDKLIKREMVTIELI